MATQKGIVRLGGSMDGITFYKAYGKDLVRKTGGPTKEQIKSDASFQRTRENNSEFGGCSKISKSIRTSLHPLKHLTDGQLGNRLTKLFKFVALNDEGVRGERPIKLSRYRDAFANFECNARCKLSQCIPGTFTFNHDKNTRTVATATIDAGQKEPIKPPQGASHFRLAHALGIVSDFIFDPATKTYIPAEPTLDTSGQIQHSDYFPIEEINASAYSSTVSLDVTTPLPDSVSVLHALGIQFFQQLGTVNYPLRQRGALKILEVI